MISYQEKKKVFEEHCRLVYYVYNKKIGSNLKQTIPKEEAEDVIQEGMLAFVHVLNTFEPREGHDYASKEFTSYAITSIQGAMLKYYFRRSSIFATSDTAFKEKYRKQTLRLLNGSFSMDKKINDDADSESFSNLLASDSNDYEDMLFYTALESFLGLIPEEERAVMRYYYYACIDCLDERLAIKNVARHFSVSTPTIKKMASRWNPELYAFLKAEKGSIENFHDSFCSDSNQHLQDEPHYELVRMIKDGKMLEVNSVMMDDYIAHGWREYSVEFLENKRNLWINNGKVTFTVRREDIPKFQAVGFVAGMGKKGECVGSPKCKTIKISNGERVEEISENLLEYWESIGYQECEKGSIKGHIRIWKGDKTTTISEDELQQYLDDGWNLGMGSVSIVSLDGEKRRVSRGELQKYLSENWILLRTYDTRQTAYPDMILINYAGLTEGFVEPEKLELFLSHGWKKGTAFMSLFVPNAPNRKSKYRRKILSGRLQEYLDKGYTLDVVKEQPNDN